MHENICVSFFNIVILYRRQFKFRYVSFIVKKLNKAVKCSLLYSEENIKGMSVGNKGLRLGISFIKLRIESLGSNLEPTPGGKVVTTQEINKKVQVGNDQEKAQSERNSHSKNRGEKNPN